IDSSRCLLRFLRAYSSLHRLLARAPAHRPPTQAANSRRTRAQYRTPPASQRRPASHHAGHQPFLGSPHHGISPRHDHAEKSLLLLVKAKLTASAGTDTTSALGDAAKAMSRKLRPTDSIYRLTPEIFGLVLPETDTLNAKRIAVRLQEELQSVRAKHGGAFETTVHNYPDDAQSSHELEDIVKSVLPAKDDYGVTAPMPAPAKA